MSKRLKELYFIFVLLFSGLSTAFFRSKQGLIVLWLTGMIVFWKENLRVSKTLLVALAVWMAYFVINALTIHGFHPYFMGTYVATIMIAYWLASLYGYEFFARYEDAIYVLSAISLFFVSLEILIPDLLSSFMNTFNLSGNLFGDKKGYATILVYTTGSEDIGSDVVQNSFIPRNAGFCWEPGPFSCFIALAIFFNLVRNNSQLKDKKRLIVFLLTLLTTQSTTGFMALFAIVIWLSQSHVKKNAFRMLLPPAAIAAIVLLFTKVPFLKDKIISESRQDVTYFLVRAQSTGNSFAPGRFASLALGWMDFLNHPIAGYGGNFTLSVGYIDETTVVATIGGLGTIISRYGAIGSILFIILIFMAGKKIGRHFNAPATFIFPLLLLIIAFGFNIIETPIVATMWLLPALVKEGPARIGNA